MFPHLHPKNCIIAVLSSAFLAFGLYHVHSCSGVTEGGILGLALLLEHLFQISPAISSFILNALCYLLGWKLLGKEFIAYSAIATVAFSVSYKIYEQFPPLWPNLYETPLLAALIGAVFIGLGAGFCVRAGGAMSGDDALAMSITHVTRLKIQTFYLISDLLVLGLSAVYIPWQRLWYSLLTVVLSGQIVGLVQEFKQKPKNKNA